MAAYLVVCIRHADCRDGGHVAHVGTGPAPGQRDRVWTVSEVWAAIDRGDTFFVGRAGTDAVGLVERWTCGCLQATLRTNGDATDVLDLLPWCGEDSGEN